MDNPTWLPDPLSWPYTPPLAVARNLLADDPILWYSMSDGDHENLFNAACEALDSERETSDKLRQKLDDLHEALTARAVRDNMKLPTVTPDRREVVQLENSTATLWAHPSADCEGRPCALHNRTNHHMRSWRQTWRPDRRIIERQCPQHGCGHPDPDAPVPPNDDLTHGCCGCCTQPSQEWLDDLCEGCGATNGCCGCGQLQDANSRE